MPNFDRTGPQGKGKGTGRKMGPCFNNPVSSPVRQGFCRYLGMGRGRQHRNGKQWSFRLERGFNTD